MSNAKLTLGVAHVALTVLDLQTTVDFFADVLGYDKIGADPDYPAAFVTDGTTMLALWQAKAPKHAIAFDRFDTIGLHHLAIGVDNNQLDALHQTLLDTKDCVVEFGPEPFYGTKSRHMMAAIPGSGIRIEFHAAAQ